MSNKGFFQCYRPFLRNWPNEIRSYILNNCNACYFTWFFSRKTFELFMEDLQIDFSTHNIKWLLRGWGVLGVDVIDLKSIFSHSIN